MNCMISYCDFKADIFYKCIMKNNYIFRDLFCVCESHKHFVFKRAFKKISKENYIKLFKTRILK